MLRIELLGEELYDDENEIFLYPDRIVVEMEHSLVSLSKWESKFEKPFLTQDEKTDDEIMAYIKCMIISPINAEEALSRFTNDHILMIKDYIDAKQTATWFNEKPGKKSTQTITNELVYYWMNAAGVPMECQHWHLNRLFTLLRVHSANNNQAQQTNGKKKGLTSDERASRAAENKRRQEMYKSKG